MGKNNKISGKRSGPPPKSGPTPQGFGYDFDSMDNKPFIYGFKDTEKALIRGAAKSKDDFNIGSYSKNFKIEASKNEFVGKQIRAGARKGGFEFEVGKNDHGKNFRIGFKKKFNMGGAAKCPHRDSSSKNMYPGNNEIQIKGFKFTGVK